MEATVFASHT